MDPGRLAPCIAHDVDGGVGKAELGWILLQIANEKLISWKFFRSKLEDLRTVLRRKDKSDLSTRLPGMLC
jgi:hypothetical protein